MGSKGDSYGNALAETTNGFYKAELIDRRAPWKIKEAVGSAMLQGWLGSDLPPSHARIGCEMNTGLTCLV